LMDVKGASHDTVDAMCSACPLKSHDTVDPVYIGEGEVCYAHGGGLCNEGFWGGSTGAKGEPAASVEMGKRRHGVNRRAE
jgi:hypothetical protein